MKLFFKGGHLVQSFQGGGFAARHLIRVDSTHTGGIGESAGSLIKAHAVHDIGVRVGRGGNDDAAGTHTKRVDGTVAAAASGQTVFRRLDTRQMFVSPLRQIDDFLGVLDPAADSEIFCPEFDSPADEHPVGLISGMSRSEKKFFRLKRTGGGNGFRDEAVSNAKVLHFGFKQDGASHTDEFFPQVFHNDPEIVASDVRVGHIGDFFRGTRTDVSGRDKSSLPGKPPCPRRELSVGKGSPAAFAECVIPGGVETAGVFKCFYTLGPPGDITASFDHGGLKAGLLEGQCGKKSGRAAADDNHFFVPFSIGYFQGRRDNRSIVLELPGRDGYLDLPMNVAFLSGIETLAFYLV